jgi:ferredoxin
VVSAGRIGIRVDRDSCAGSGACALFVPEYFDEYFDQSDEDGLVLPRVHDAPVEALPELRSAVRRCPAAAIDLLEPEAPRPTDR